MRKHMEKQKGIQTTLFDYFNDTEYFTKKRRKAPAFRYGDIRRIQISE